MKELVYRDMLGRNPRKHEVSIEEILDSSGKLVSKRKTCKYFIKDSFSSLIVDRLKRWIREKQEKGFRKRQHMLSSCDARLKENKIICKTLGDFFVVFGQTAYEVVYVNEIRIRIKDRIQ